MPQTRSFYQAYDAYYQSIDEAIANLTHPISVLEIGGGAHPSLIERSNLSYTIVDPDNKELAKSPLDVVRINSLVQDLPKNKKYDLIISKMVLEHVEDSDSFHKSVLGLLSDQGTAIHFFACRHSVPALVNRLLPEFIGDIVLRLLNNRDLENEPKYKAYYLRTLGHTTEQLDYFHLLGYDVVNYQSFVGHKYLQRIPLLGKLERWYTDRLVDKDRYDRATVALLVMNMNKAQRDYDYE